MWVFKRLHGPRGYTGPEVGDVHLQKGTWGWSEHAQDTPGTEPSLRRRCRAAIGPRGRTEPQPVFPYGTRSQQGGLSAAGLLTGTDLRGSALMLGTKLSKRKRSSFPQAKAERDGGRIGKLCYVIRQRGGNSIKREGSLHYSHSLTQQVFFEHCPCAKHRALGDTSSGFRGAYVSITH